MLEIKNLTFNPLGERNILDNINLSIPDGKLIVLTGPNGGGKTTLAKMIAGVEKPSSGQILLDGKDITDLDVTDRAKIGISYALQQPVRFKGISVTDLLRIAHGGSITDEEVRDVLERVGMTYDAYAHRQVDTKLSGGEIKRIEIASVLLRKSRVAVFDEPEAGIDLWSFNNLIRVFENIRDERDKSLVVISHQERILSIADEIIMIQGGKVGLSGSGKKIFKSLLCKNDCSSCDSCKGKETK